MSEPDGGRCAFRMESPTAPLVFAAIHAGHEIRAELEPYLALSEEERLREEDPFTDRWLPTHGRCAQMGRIVVHRSRFECDMNRPRESAIYRTPEQAWGLTVWNGSVPPAVHARSLELYDRFYEVLGSYFDATLDELDRLIVLDLHNYNHRRSGPETEPAQVSSNPDFNLGTAGVAARSVWAGVIGECLSFLRSAGACGESASVGENVKFGGGHMGRWLHARYGARICVLSLEVKKFFMDEWTGRPREECVAEIGSVIARLGERLVGLM